jgi:hypothetical protein
VSAADPFELPEWLGTDPVTWTARSRVRGAQRITGCLAGGAARLACDLMAADVAYPQPLLDDDWRRQVHLAWEHGQVLLLTYDDRLTLAVPGTAYSADGTLETISRFAKAVGVPAGRFTVCLQL